MSSGLRRVFAAVVLVGTLAISGCVTPESYFPTLTNQARGAAGLGPLSTEPPGGMHFYNKAKAHAEAMCRAGAMYHSATDTQLGAYYQPPAGWRSLAENVGVTGWNQNDQNSQTASTNSLWNAFMNSPGHRAHILGSFNYQVVAQQVCGDGKIYVTHVFILY